MSLLDGHDGQFVLLKSAYEAGGHVVHVVLDVAAMALEYLPLEQDRHGKCPVFDLKVPPGHA